MIDSKKVNKNQIPPITSALILTSTLDNPHDHTPSKTSDPENNHTFIVHESVVTEEPSYQYKRSLSHSSSEEESESKKRKRHLISDDSRSVRKIRPQLMPKGRVLQVAPVAS